MKKRKVIIGYKSVTSDLKSGYGNCQWKVGEWKKHIGDLKICESGFHASRHPYDVINSYLQGDRLFLVEAKGIEEQTDKFVAKEMRLKVEIKDLKRLSVEFSIWNARRCLPNFEKKYPKDDRVRKAIEAAEKWLKAKNEAEKSAAESAASAAWSAASAASAAESAAWSAAESAASAAWSAASAASAAESAAWSAAWSAASAAWSAASAARSAAESAAWSAAESAAWSAASAAWSAASAARSAAESAAWSAARKKFLQLCKKYMEKQK